MAKIFELEVLMKSLLEKLNVIEMSNENQVINVDREDYSAISCVEEKCTVHLIQGVDEAADIFWMLLALETFSLRNLDALVEECLKKGIVNIH